ncbi:hypothetical protein SEA_OTTAWA_70 [Arthrobacter phage Ottawa]|nr:hypothetical protein SEA_KHARCHO_70 [Arthrobacter phage Kharcho]WIC89302.1 hypothetical protein SEA_OTTAWA_70 [Arthrobacter phage Ottawa]
MSPANNLRPEHGPDVIAKVLASTAPNAQIARELNIATATAWRIRKRHGAPTVTTHFTTTNPASIARRKARQEAAKEGAANRISTLDRIRRMAEIDESYVKANREPNPGRCCSRCKTPYNCGNKECKCHG